MTDSNGCSGTSDPHVVTITPCIPNILYSSHGSFTELTGDGDSYFEKGEKWSVPVTVTNSGNTPATNVTAVFSSNGITVCNPTGSFGTITAGGTGTFTYSFVIDNDFTPCGGNINFNLGSKTSTELTPAGTDETNLFLVQVGQIAAGVPTDLVLQPSTADSYVNQGSAGTNYGSGATMSVQSRLSQAQRTLVMFDLSAIPEDSTINTATLELYASSAPTTGLTLNVHRITGTWTEPGVTWTNQPAYNSTVDASLAGGTTTGWKIWNIASLVQDWVDGTSDNYGLIVKGSVENDKTAVTYAFASKENGTSGNRPILRINYTPPTTMNCDYVGPGECDAILAECAPGDIYENGQTWSGTSQSWPALTGATGYKLYRGIQSGLPNLLTADPDSCLRYEGSSTSIDLSADDPSSEIGRLYWYIVSGTNGSGEGPAGNGRIVNSSGICE
ncbi:MAG TPA: DNRLRE domain-containing protein [Acidobacteriota bacterium]|nr:DNRLRE domain-containing protein [Acidobacteriota bacterium]HQQ46304.1 DNRLRE domain-containing protein [Acidobacteriota bacterium]